MRSIEMNGKLANRGIKKKNYSKHSNCARTLFEKSHFIFIERKNTTSTFFSAFFQSTQCQQKLLR